MIETRVLVEYRGRHYETNVITNKKKADTEIKHLAEMQVSKQWGNNVLI